jgi:hypothetical protein
MRAKLRMIKAELWQRTHQPCGHSSLSERSATSIRMCTANIIANVVPTRKNLAEGVHLMPTVAGRRLLEHHETELCSPSHRFGPTIRI